MISFDIDLLHSLLTLDGSTGRVHWRPRSASHFCDKGHKAEHICSYWNSRFAGKEALIAVDKDGYRYGSIQGVRTMAHRVIYAMHTGAWPQGQVDHINGNPADNRPANLRDVPRADNQRNMALTARNKSGFHGVSWREGKQRWQARIRIAGREVSLGHFEQIEDAVAARKSMERALSYHENHGRPPARGMDPSWLGWCEQVQL